MRWTDGRGSKPRPAAVLSTTTYQRERRDIVIVGLTAQLDGDRVGDYRLVDWQAAGLRSPTKSKAVIATVERSTVRKTLGSLSAGDFAEIEQSVRVVLGL